MCANFFVQGQEFDIPSMNNLKGQVRKLKDALAKTLWKGKFSKHLQAQIFYLLKDRLVVYVSILFHLFPTYIP